MTREIVYWLSTLSAGASALSAFLLAYPGDLVPQTVLLCVGAVAFTLAAMVAFANRQPGA
jgi:hypothetical protein